MATPWYDYSLGQAFTLPSGGSHDGRDIQTPTGTPLSDILPGVVTSHTGFYPWGGEVDVLTASGITETWAHLDALAVKPGQTVSPGQLIGLSGGENLPAQYSTGPHTHFSLFGAAPWDNSAAIDPTPLLQWAQSFMGSGPGVGSQAAPIYQLTTNAASPFSTQASGILTNLQTNFSKYAWMTGLIILGGLLILAGLIVAILPGAEKAVGTTVGAAVKAP